MRWLQCEISGVLEESGEGSRSNFYVRESAVLGLRLLSIYSLFSQETGSLGVYNPLKAFFLLCCTGPRVVTLPRILQLPLGKNYKIPLERGT